MQPTVFLGAASLIVAFVLFGTLATDLARETFQFIQQGILTKFGWFYALTMAVLLVFVLWLLLGPHGEIRLGGKDARPEFSYVTWVGMLFAAGMGIGLVFWGVAEPISHFETPPMAEPESRDAWQEAMRFSFFHWCLQPWAVYVVFSLALAYFHFRFELPLAPRSMLYPVLGKYTFAFPGHLIDIIATVGTLFGVATSLGLGAMQINAGLGNLAQVPQATWVRIVIIASITLVATISVVTGIHRGIPILSKINLSLAGVLLLFVFVTGPTVYLIETFVSTTGTYLQNLPAMSLWISSGEAGGWQADWTFFYWSWWISWSPFVGVFTARISKGRTVREFVLNVLLVPSVLTAFWLSVFGGTARHLAEQGVTSISEAVSENPALSLHALLNELPIDGFTTILATIVVIIFFITSSDSGSLVDDMVTSGGHPNPPAAQRVFWAVSEGAVAATLLLAGGLQALRTASLISGIPMAIILLVAAYGLAKSLAVDQAGRPPDRKDLLVRKSE